MFLSEAASGGPQFFYLAPWIVFIPVIGLMVNILFGARLGEKAVGAIASSAAGLAFGVAVLLAVSLVGHPDGVVIPLFEWIHIGDLNIHWAFRWIHSRW